MEKVNKLFLFGLVLLVLPMMLAYNFDEGVFGFTSTPEEIIANLIGQCQTNYVVAGINSDGTKICILDQTGAGGTSLSGANPYLFNDSVSIYGNSSYINATYYLKSNPFGFYNSTNFDINNYYLKSNPFSFFNITSLANVSQLLNDNHYWNDTYATLNKTYTDTLYCLITEPLWTNNQSNYYNKSVIGTNFSNYLNSTQSDTAFVNASGDVMTGGINMTGIFNTTQNLTIGGNITIRGTTNSYIYNNGTYVIWD